MQYNVWIEVEQGGEEAGCYQNLDLPYGQCATFENEEVSE